MSPLAKDLVIGKISLFSNTRFLCWKLFYVAFVCEKGKFLSNRIVCRLSNPSKIRVVFFFLEKGYVSISYKLNPSSLCCLVIRTVWKLIIFLTSKFPGERRDKARGITDRAQTVFLCPQMRHLQYTLFNPLSLPINRKIK